MLEDGAPYLPPSFKVAVEFGLLSLFKEDLRRDVDKDDPLRADWSAFWGYGVGRCFNGKIAVLFYVRRWEGVVDLGRSNRTNSSSY